MVKRDLEKVFPKDNLYIALIYAFTMFAVLFGLKWYEVIIAVVIDTLAIVVMSKPDLKIFYYLNPRLVKFKNIEEYADSAKTLEEQNEFFNLLSSYPEKRSLDVFFVSLFKVLPVGIYISFVSEISSFWGNLALFYLADVFILAYVSGLLFIQLHDITSALMGELRSHENWIFNYPELKLTNIQDRFSKIQNSLLVVMLINLFCLVVFTMKLDSVNSNYYIFILFASAIFAIGRIQILFQRFFRKTLLSMFEAFDRSLTTKKLDVLPIHTSPLVASFEYTFNQLGVKLEEREKEISQWLKHESSQFHLKALGEVTAMVAHDMKTPLHVMSMSLEMMNSENLTPENKKKYQEILERNLNQSIAFSKTLMAYVRGSKDEENCVFGDIHNYLLDLFKTQFSESDLSRIDFKISDEAKSVVLKVTRMDAMHIFYNLYQNAIKTVLLDEAPAITIECQIQHHYAIILLHNSGPSLAPDKFYNLISFDRFNNDNQFYNGLGLRLTNSILTHLKGALDIAHVEQGTCLKISLPCETSRQLDLDIDPDSSEDTVQ